MPGTYIQVTDTWYQVATCNRYMEQDTRNKEQQVASSWYQVPGTRYLDIQCMEPNKRSDDSNTEHRTRTPNSLNSVHCQPCLKTTSIIIPVRDPQQHIMHIDMRVDAFIYVWICFICVLMRFIHVSIRVVSVWIRCCVLWWICDFLTQCLFVCNISQNSQRVILKFPRFGIWQDNQCRQAHQQMIIGK